MCLKEQTIGVERDLEYFRKFQIFLRGVDSRCQHEQVSVYYHIFLENRIEYRYPDPAVRIIRADLFNLRFVFESVSEEQCSPVAKF